MRIAIVIVVAAGSANGVAAECRPHRVAIIGDSITLGRNDAAGGFPKRAEAILRATPETFAIVLNRGFGGSTTGSWLAPPSTATWNRFAELHADLAGAPPAGASLAAAVATLDQPLDAIVILLGVNDRVFHGRSVAQVAANLHSLQESLRPFATVVIVSTLPPSTNPIARAGIAEMNEVIRAEFPGFLPLGDAFGLLPNWPGLLEQSVHPTPKGHAALASIAASQLLDRGLVGALSPTAGGCECFAAKDGSHPLALCLPVPRADRR